MASNVGSDSDSDSDSVPLRIPKYLVNGTEINMEVLEHVSGSDTVVNDAVETVSQFLVFAASESKPEWAALSRPWWWWSSSWSSSSWSSSWSARSAFAAAFAVIEKRTYTGEPVHELHARACALILVMVEERRRGNAAADEIEHVVRDLRYLLQLFQKLYNMDEPEPMLLLLQNDAQRIASCYARLNNAMERYAVDFRIRNAAGLAELGTGIRTVKELTVTGLQEHQLVSPFGRPSSKSGLSDDTASQITWMAYNPPWNSRGGFADLFIGWHTIVGKVALKRLRIDDAFDDATEKRFERERDMWQHLRHDNILQLLGTFIHDKYWYFVSPFMENGSLPRYLKNDPSVDRLRLLREIANALTYLHEKGVVHGDIKADNILVSDDLHAQLCDFGLAKFFGSTTVTALKGAGSAQWKSPELWDEEPKTPESDVYAFGMTIVEVLTGDIPFPGLKTIPRLYKAVHLLGQRPPKEPESSPEGVSYNRAWNVAERCWPADPNERISMAVARNDLSLDVEQAAGSHSDPLCASNPESGAQTGGTGASEVLSLGVI